MKTMTGAVAACISLEFSSDDDDDDDQNQFRYKFRAFLLLFLWVVGSRICRKLFALPLPRESSCLLFFILRKMKMFLR